MGAVMTRHLVSCLVTVRQIRAAYDTGARASDPKTNKQTLLPGSLARPASPTAACQTST